MRCARGDAPATGASRVVIIGKDTRISNYMFEAALEAGLVAAGVDVQLMGPMPTPAVAHLTRSLRADGGIVISASHNPHHDNGIKFFSRRGEKLDDATELAIEAALEHPFRTVASEQLGKAVRTRDAIGRYVEACKNSVPRQLRPGRHAHRDRLREWRDLPDRARWCCANSAPCRRDRHRAQRPQHQRRRRLDASGTAGRARARNRRRPRHRLRRRRRPRAVRRRRRRIVRWRRPDLRAGQRLAADRPPARPGGRHADDQLRPGAGARRARHRVRARQGRRPLRAPGAGRTTTACSAAKPPATCCAWTAPAPATASSARCRCWKCCSRTRRSLREALAGLAKVPQKTINVRLANGARPAEAESVQAALGRGAAARLPAVAARSCVRPAPSPWCGSPSRPTMMV